MSLTRDEAKALVQAINGALGLALDKLVRNGGPEPERKANVGVLAGSPLAVGAGQSGETTTVSAQGDFEALYQKIKRRLLDECRVDPVLVQLLARSAPEIELEIEPRRIELTESTLKGRIVRLLSKGFFDAEQTQAATNRELARTGAMAHAGRLSEAFSALVIDGILTREGDGFRRAPGLKVTEKHVEAR